MPSKIVTALLLVSYNSAFMDYYRLIFCYGINVPNLHITGIHFR
jgi:hypothetical protein